MPLPLVIAAAGRSARYGRPKLLETIPGKSLTLIEHVVRQCVTGGAGPVVVVLGPESVEPFGKIGEKLRGCGAIAVHHEPAPREMRESIEIGVRYLEAMVEVAAGLALPVHFGFMPADLPGVEADFVRRLIGQCERSGSVLIRGVTPQGRGLHPVAMRWSQRAALFALPGECGLNQLWRMPELSRAEFVDEVERMRYDLDIPQDWEKFAILRERKID